VLAAALKIMPPWLSRSRPNGPERRNCVLALSAHAVSGLTLAPGGVVGIAPVREKAFNLGI
jgi:hypothetical protein